MLGLIIRNFRNAGKNNVGLGLSVPDPSDETGMRQVMMHVGTGLDIHNLAGKGHRDLLRMASQSQLPRRRGVKFEDEAWPVAASILVRAAIGMELRSPETWGVNLHYVAFLGEYATMDYEADELRELLIREDGTVTIRRAALGKLTYTDLGNYKRA